MKELNAIQEEFILELSLEKHREGKAEVLFNEWLSDNIIGLQRDFIEEYNSIFIEFCKEAYKQECEDLI